jgi:hypothetical protein
MSGFYLIFLSIGRDGILKFLSSGRGYESLAACCLAEVGEGLRTLDSAEPLTNFD